MEDCGRKGKTMLLFVEVDLHEPQKRGCCNLNKVLSKWKNYSLYE